MAEKTNNKRMSLMLLQESIWKIEDKINIILEGIADHEAELIRIRNSMNLLLQRLDISESHSNRSAKGGRNGRQSTH